MPLQCCCISAVRLPQPSSPARHRPLRLLSTLRRAARRRRQLPIRAAPQGARRPGLLAAWAPSAAAASLMLLAWHGWHGADKGVPSVRLSLASPPTGHRAIKVSPAPRPPQFPPSCPRGRKPSSFNARHNVPLYLQCPSMPPPSGASVANEEGRPRRAVLLGVACPLRPANLPRVCRMQGSPTTRS